jgi:hypothetical protein
MRDILWFWVVSHDESMSWLSLLDCAEKPKGIAVGRIRWILRADCALRMTPLL